MMEVLVAVDLFQRAIEPPPETVTPLSMVTVRFGLVITKFAQLELMVVAFAVQV